MADQTQHTPGPWTLNQPGDDCRPYIICDTSNGKAIHRCAVAFGTPTGGQGHPYIGVDYPLKVAEANARLIAAAPRTVARLLRLIRLSYEGAGHVASIEILRAEQDIKDATGMDWTEYEAAIAKAGGQSS